MIYSWCLPISFYFNDDFNTDVKTFFVFTAVHEREADISKKIPRGWFAISEQGQLWAFFISYTEEKNGRKKKPSSFFSLALKLLCFCDLFWAQILEHWLNMYATS